MGVRVWNIIKWGIKIDLLIARDLTQDLISPCHRVSFSSDLKLFVTDNWVVAGGTMLCFIEIEFSYI